MAEKVELRPSQQVLDAQYAGLFRSTGLEVIGTATSIDYNKSLSKQRVCCSPGVFVEKKKKLDGTNGSSLEIDYLPRTQKYPSSICSIDLDENGEATAVHFDIKLSHSNTLSSAWNMNSTELECADSLGSTSDRFHALTGLDRIGKKPLTAQEYISIASNCVLYFYALEHNLQPEQLISMANAIRVVELLQLRQKGFNVQSMLNTFNGGSSSYKAGIKGGGELEVKIFNRPQGVNACIEPGATLTATRDMNPVDAISLQVAVGGTTSMLEHHACWQVVRAKGGLGALHISRFSGNTIRNTDLGKVWSATPSQRIQRKDISETLTFLQLPEQTVHFADELQCLSGVFIPLAVASY